MHAGLHVSRVDGSPMTFNEPEPKLRTSSYAGRTLRSGSWARSRTPDNRPMLTTDSPSAAVRVLTLDRPDDLNAMTAELCQALHDELDRIAADRSCRAVVLTGAGRAFCVGLDLKGYGEAPGTTAPTTRATGSATRSTCRA